MDIEKSTRYNKCEFEECIFLHSYIVSIMCHSWLIPMEAGNRCIDTATTVIAASFRFYIRSRSTLPVTLAWWLKVAGGDQQHWDAQKIKYLY